MNRQGLQSFEFLSSPKFLTAKTATYHHNDHRPQYISKMLRQALSAPSRAARSSLRIATHARVARPHFYQIPSIALRAAQPSVARWYSAEAESTPKEATEAPKEGEAKNGAADEAAALKKQLEEKEAEIRDWKVRQEEPLAPLASSPLTQLRTNSCAQ
jgi:hypothetical protein